MYVMKLNSSFALPSLVCLLLSCLFLVPVKGTAQSSGNIFALENTGIQGKTDVMAYLVRNGNEENYTLKVDNPSRKKLKIYLFADGVRYSYYASAPRVSKLFDFNGAEDGVYTFVIQDGKTRLRKDIEITTIVLTKKEIRVASR